MTVSLIVLVGWSVVLGFVLALCKVASRAEASSERMHAAWLAHRRAVETSPHHLIRPRRSA